MSPTATSRVDLHCHSTASAVSKLGVQRSLGLPECATPPEEVYDLAKRRGMDFVTITDHDTIDGCLELDDRPDCFISEELTAWFAGEPQAVHVLCFGISPDDHEWLQAHASDLERCAEYLHSRQIACALAHPFYAVEAPLTPVHRRRLAQLFPIWETRNGSRAPELNLPAAVYIETQGGIGTGGSDDHAGVDIGRTYTETPSAATPEELMGHLREGRAQARGEQGSFAKWTHAAIALATRSLLSHQKVDQVSADSVLRIVERVLHEGATRRGDDASDLGPADAAALLDSFLSAIGVEQRGMELVELMQADDFDHRGLARRAKRIHEQRMGEAARAAGDRFAAGLADDELPRAAVTTGRELFEAAMPAIPYAPSAAFLGREKRRLVPGEGPPRVALIADGIGAMHGVTHTIERTRELGVPGFEVEVIGTDASVDRRLSSVAELEMPFYPGLAIGVPSLPAMVEALAEGGYDLVHLTAPGPSGVTAALLARTMELPIVGSWHTEFGHYAGLRTGSETARGWTRMAMSLFYRQCGLVLSPSPASDASLREHGIEQGRMQRWERGVDAVRFDPAKADRAAYPGRIKVLYAGRLSSEKGVGLLAESFVRARASDPRLHLLVAGGGPEEESLRRQLGEWATFLGWLRGEDLPRAYASSDVFLFCSRTDTYGQVVMEAAASGLPAVAVDEGGPATLIEDGVTGRLCPPDPDLIAAALLQLADAPAYRAKLGAQALRAARERSWEAAMVQLAAAYRTALNQAGGEPVAIARAA
jgi:glycosyltransferase involved in cell wall biosynthesis/predicted metal-dependent phosphoesterase TrpH